MPKPPCDLQRRDFLKTSAAAICVPTIVSASAFANHNRPAPSDRITVGIIGLGSRGFNLIDSFLAQGDARIVAICDVDSFHYRDRAWGQGSPFGLLPAQQKIEKEYDDSIATTRDFREICSRGDVDAVVIATPDHWHALCTLEALRNGKDVYCEKPLTHTFAEGRAVCREVAKRRAVFQTGSQQRSDALFRKAVELVINGHLGKVQRVEVGLPPGYDQPQGETKIYAPPKQLDYDMWCGPAPRLPYMRARHHRWWRGHRAYGGGVLMDWIGHHNDIAHWALGVDRLGPTKINAANWTFPATDVYDTPHHYEIHCEYAGGIITSISSRHRLGTRVIGEDGWVFVTRGKLEASDRAWSGKDFDPGAKKAYASADHTRNFLDCVKSRAECIAPAEVAHRSITPGHLGYISQALGRELRWDPAQELVIDDMHADQLLKQNVYREPWA